MSKNIYVTQPDLPPLDEFMPYLQEIWKSKILTNGGPFHQKLEHSLCEYLGVSHLALVTNATIGLVTALQALRITGEVKDWVGHSEQELKAMFEHLEKLKQQGVEAIDD